MNVLVVNPPNVPFTNHSLLAPPLDVLGVATLVKKHFQTTFLDMDALRKKTIDEEILKATDVIIVVMDYQIPLHTEEAFQHVLEMIRNYGKEKKFILIGKTPTYFCEQYIKAGAFVIIRGIYDRILIPVLEHINSIEALREIPNLVLHDMTVTKRIFEKGDYKSLPIPDYSLVDFNLYMDTATMITSRGCDGTCKYCCTPYFFHQFQNREVKDIVDEIELLTTIYCKKKIIFLDDNMTISKSHMIELCEEIKKRNIKALFGCLSSIIHYDKELFQMMYQTGFRWVHFGLESGSEEVLKAMGKPMKIECVKKVINEVKQIGFRVRTSFILDYPTSTLDDLKKTEDLILELQPHEIRLHYLAYRPGTPLTKEHPEQKVSAYIHKSKAETPFYSKEVLLFLKNLEKSGYLVMMEDQEWNAFTNLEKTQKFVSLVPMKYGMCWYE